MEVITYSEWIDQTDRQTAQQIALLKAQSGVDGIVDLDNVAAFPAVGVEGVLYLAKDTGKLYSWNTATEKYVRADSDLPVATNEKLGGVKVGSRLTITEEGVLSANEYELPTATADDLGGVKVGTGLTIANGVLSYTLPTATADALGGVRIGNGITIASGLISVSTDYAPSSHVGATGTVHGAATTSVSGFMSSADKTKLDGIAENANNYTLPTASSTVLGGVRVGDSLFIDGEVLEVNFPDTNIVKNIQIIASDEETINANTSVAIGTVEEGVEEPSLENYSVNLPASSVGKVLKVKNMGDIPMLIIPYETETIDGVNSPVELAQSEATTLLCYETGKWCKL